MRPMQPHAADLVLLAAAALALGFGGYYWWSVAGRAAPARRGHLKAQGFCSAGLALLTALSFASGAVPGALAFAAVTALALGQTFVTWRQTRRGK